MSSKWSQRRSQALQAAAGGNMELNLCEFERPYGTASLKFWLPYSIQAMNNSFQRVLSKLMSFYGCVPKIADEEKSRIFVPAVIAKMFAIDLTRMGVRIESIGVWEYVDLVDPPAKWGRKGECDDQGYGRLTECLDLNWHAPQDLPAQDLAEVNEAARKFLDSLADTDAFRAVGEARLWVDLVLNCQAMRRVVGH